VSALLLSPDAIHRLGWTLIHFLWQGFALAILCQVVMLLVRKAGARYILALGAFAAMALCPIVTFLALRPGAVPGLSFAPAFNGLAVLPAILPSVATADASAGYDWPSIFVLFWLAGILVFALRALGGWIVLERLCRENTDVLSTQLRQRCLSFQRRLGITKAVRYLESHSLDAPAVVGWLRPIVLLPVTAITGLSEQQLDAIIAHELAHIRRHDSLVNLFQVAVESCLFYHPAIWWLSRRVRAEREHCCDDIAVTVCGDAAEYARALVLMEQWRATPAFAMGANHGSLRSRIARILGMPVTAGVVRTRGLSAIGILVTAGALFASTSLTKTIPALSELSFNVSGRPATIPPYTPESPTASDTTQPSRKPVQFTLASAQSERPAAPQSTRQPDNAAGGESYIAGLESVGLKNLTADQLIALKVQGVTPQYVRELHAAGLNPDVNHLVALKVQGVDPAYVRDIRSTGLNPSLNDLVALRVQGVTPDYVRQIQSQGFKNVSVQDIIGMRVQGVKPSDFAEFERLGLKGMSVHDLISFRVQGVTPDYIHLMQSAGFTNLRTQDYIAAKVQGITPEFIQKAKSRGFTNLNLRQLIALKNTGAL
jgi:beta-lactamase regulating signal transducer with metallopeptidase domain